MLIKRKRKRKGCLPNTKEKKIGQNYTLVNKYHIYVFITIVDVSVKTQNGILYCIYVLVHHEQTHFLVDDIFYCIYTHLEVYRHVSENDCRCIHINTCMRKTTYWYTNINMSVYVCMYVCVYIWYTLTVTGGRK